MAAVSFLRNVPVLARLSRELLEQVSEQVVTRSVPAGDWIFHDGDPADGMYIIRGGRVEVVAEGPPRR